MATRTPARKTVTKSTPVKKAPTVKMASPTPNATPPQAAAIERKVPKLRAKLVRDGFTMPESDFALIAVLKSRAMQAGREAKKSELLRAGLHALAALEPPSLVTALSGLQAIKTGRPKKGH